MATLFSHAAVAVAGGACSRLPRRAIVVGAFLAMLPDLDVLGFGIGIAYLDPLGHRGFSHSIAFAALVGLLCWFLGPRYRLIEDGQRQAFTVYAFLCTASHGVLDALTMGGQGVAFFSPFDLDRYFFPWRPIAVSAIGLDFFTVQSWAVIRSELIWLGIPLVLVWAGDRWIIQRRV